jgi:hypothetical protein
MIGSSIYDLRIVSWSSRRWTHAALAILVFVLSHRVANDLTADEGITFFETSVRPLLVEHCQHCHGSKKQEGGLRLDGRQALLTGGDSGPAVNLDQPAKSLILIAVGHGTDLKMPPDKKLAASQIETLERWVKSGAPWPDAPVVSNEAMAKVHAEHWAFQPIKNPPLPAIHNSDWERTLIDRFVLAKLENAGLRPSPAADRRTLIRRVTLDLTGLLPTPEQVEAFVNDPAPNAYSKLVERLLDSPQYGEQWARHWLDVARYSDTKGYVYGREERFWVHAPAYRDWVINAFNRDLPYDQFLLLQIAADQAAPENQRDLAAMGFLTLGRRFLGLTHDIIDDRIDVVMRGTMGLTAACARCHDHKYDPIPTTDYYSLYGIFLNSAERLVPCAEPDLNVPGYADFQKELDQRQQKLRETTLLKRNEAADRIRQRVTDYLVAQTELSKYPQEGFDQILAVTDLIPTIVHRWQARIAASRAQVGLTDPVFDPWNAFASIPESEFPAKSAFVLNELVNAKTANSRVLKTLIPAPDSMKEVANRYGTLFVTIEQEWKANCERAKSAGLAEPTRFDDPESEQLRQVLYGLGSPSIVPDESIVSTELYFDSGTVNELWKLQNEVDRWLIQSPIAPAHSVALVDRAVMRPSVVFRRGNPANRGQEVPRHFVSVVAGPQPPAFQVGSGRLELARAIIDPQNPLTARVWVNRVWQHHFGHGLVRTPSDFGIRAEPPSHPELLDWLSTKFVTDGWSTKSLHRLIVLSNTYQQRSDGLSNESGSESRPRGAENGSTGTAANASRIDPDNRLLSRMNVRRLSFEEFRDNLLAIAGRLDLQRGGRASDLFAGNGTTNRRRTIYGLVDRQFLPATLRMFDFANPDLHIPLRSETTVPQQALFALNYPFVAQQAQSLVARIRDAGSDDMERVRSLYRLVYQRDPTRHQIETAMTFLAGDSTEPALKQSPESLAWKYGYGELDESARLLKSFQPLPYYSGTGWQGGPQWPDPALGWVQVTATGGHPGNDIKHCSVRRWIAPRDGTYSVTSTAIHEVAAGNGIRCWIFSSRDGMLAMQVLHNQRKDLNIDSVVVKQGDTLDFVVDVNGELNSDQHLWAPVVREIASGTSPTDSNASTWDATRDFAGPAPTLLSNWEQLAQVLLIANELMFVD